MSNSTLTIGLYLLATSSQRYPDIWFMGHSGSAVLAGHFLLAEHTLSAETSQLINKQLDASIERECIDAELLHSWVRANHVKDQSTIDANMRTLLDQVMLNCRTLSTTGHGVIYASFALKVLQQIPELASADTVNGLIELLALTLHDNPARYYGCEDYSQLSDDISAFSEESTIESVAVKNLAEHTSIYDDQSYDGRHYYFAGNALHSLTFADALLTLKKLGYYEQSDVGVSALQKHISLSSLRPADLPKLPHKPYVDPADPTYWQGENKDPHHLKAAYSLMNLFELIPETEAASIKQTMASYG